MQNSAYTKLLNHGNALELLKMSKNWSWKRTGSSKYQKFACSENLGQNIRTKWSSPVKLDKKRKVWYLFLRVLICYLQSLSS